MAGSNKSGNKKTPRKPLGRSNDKRQRFVKEYVKNPNAGEAAIAAGYEHKLTGYTLKTKPEVKRWLAEEQARWSEKSDIKVADILEELRCIGMSDLSDVLDSDGRPLPLDEVPYHARRAIRSMKIRRVDDMVEIIDYELWDKLAALDKIGKHFGAFIEQVNLNHTHRHYHHQASFASMPKDLLAEVVASCSIETRVKVINWLRKHGGNDADENQNRIPAAIAVEARDGIDQVESPAVPGRPLADAERGDGDGPADQQ